MARPSGLASEHHPLGPGDAPRRRKSRKSTPSVEFAQGSKRAASPTTDHSSPVKRKRVQSDDHDQLAREVEESASRSQSQLSDRVISVHTTRHARRNSEPVVAFADDEEEDDDVQLTPTASTQPLPGLTPHLQRIGVRGRPTNAARRVRQSMPAHFRLEPVDEANGTQIQYAPFKATLDSRTRRRLKRNHLSEEVNDLEEHQKEDKKLRKAYLELNRQLAEKNNTIRDLEFQLEARRMGEINLTDDETEDLRTKLSQAQREIEELRASSVYRGDSRETSAFDVNMDGAMDDYDDDDEPLLAIDPNDPDGPEMEDAEPLPVGEYATRVLELSSQVTLDSLKTLTQTSYDALAETSQRDQSAVSDKISDQAVKRYESDIARLSALLGEAQGALRVTALELQNLSLLPPGASSDAILTELRHCLETIREELDNLLPGTTTGLTNSELLRKIPTLFEGVLSELHEKTIAAETHYQNARVMRSQYENVLGLLERSEARNEDLDTRVAELEKVSEERRVDIAELEERVTTLDALTDQQENEMKEKDTQIHALRDENEDKETALSRLRDSLEKYRGDLDHVTATATRMEEEYRQQIDELNEAHAAQVLDLQAQLQDENEHRLQAEGEAEQKSEYIDELQENIQRIEQQVANVTEDLEQLRDRLLAETREHNQTKDQLQGERDQVYAQKVTIENLEEELAQLKADLADMQNDLEAERDQRQQTEALLEEANAQIEELDERVRQSGMEAQGLKSKLWEVQLAKEETLKQLQEEAQDRETSLQRSLDTETEAREAAEQTISDLDRQISQLQDDLAARNDELAGLNEQLTNAEKAREETVAALGTQLADLKQKFAALENTSNSTIASLQANITDLTNEVNAHKAEIDRITTEAAENERNLLEELAQKNQQIAQLQGDLDTSRQNYQQLSKEHDEQLERFSVESDQFFKVQDKFVREQKAMEKKHQDLEARIRDLEDMAAQRALEHETALVEKNTEIQELRLMGDARAETIVELETQIDELKVAYANTEKDNRETIDKLLATQRQMQQQHESLAAALKKRNAETNQAIQDMQVKGVAITAKKVDLHKVAHGKIAKVSERVKIGKKGRKVVKERKWRDSGFGADSDIENEDVEVEQNGLEEVVG